MVHVVKIQDKLLTEMVHKCAAVNISQGKKLLILECAVKLFYHMLNDKLIFTDVFVFTYTF